MGTRGESGVLGRKKPNIKQIVRKKSVEKISKIGEIGKKSDFFFTENGLKCIRNPKKHL